MGCHEEKGEDTAGRVRAVEAIADVRSAESKATAGIRTPDLQFTKLPL